MSALIPVRNSGRCRRSIPGRCPRRGSTNHRRGTPLGSARQAPVASRAGDRADRSWASPRSCRPATPPRPRPATRRAENRSSPCTDGVDIRRTARSISSVAATPSGSSSANAPASTPTLSGLARSHRPDRGLDGRRPPGSPDDRHCPYPTPPIASSRPPTAPDRRNSCPGCQIPSTLDDRPSSAATGHVDL